MSNDKEFEDNFEDDADDSMAGDDDFVEEDWEAYDDEEQYIDDSDGDGGLAARRAAFNKVLIGGAVLLIAGGGAYFMMSGQEENLGLPKMQKVSTAANVPADQKVEFHAETKVEATDPYGVKYGEEVTQEYQDESKKTPQHGLLHNPEILNRVRKGETVTYEGAGDAAATQAAKIFKPGPELVETQPPMPSPISGTGEAAEGKSPDYSDEFELTPDEQQGGPVASPPGETAGLLPLPRGPEAAGAGMKETYEQAERSGQADDFAGTARAIEDEGLQAADTDMQSEAAGQLPETQPDGEAMAAPQSRSLSMGKDSVSEAILDRLDSMEASLQAMRGSIEDVETRLSRIEKKQGGATPNISSGASRPKKTAAPVSAPVAQPKTVPAQAGGSQWVLRSAQPGQAMISRKGETDMKTVAIGETLPGLGRITGVFQQDGKWVVQGDKGRITQ